MFSNTDSPSPNIDHLNQIKKLMLQIMDSKKKEYVERKVHSLLEK